MNTVTEPFIRKFKAGDLVDVRVKHGRWTGPHKLLKYEIDPPKKGVNPTAHLEIELGEKKKLKRLLIAGDQQVIRQHIPEEQKQRVRVKRVG